MNPENNHISCANIAPDAACCQGLHDGSNVLMAAWQ
jgi:hypothetical protein